MFYYYLASLQKRINDGNLWALRMSLRFIIEQKYFWFGSLLCFDLRSDLNHLFHVCSCNKSEWIILLNYVEAIWNLSSMCSQLEPSRYNVALFQCLNIYSIDFFPFVFLQDSDSPRHSTASNSSTFSSPPSPASPHKTKSLSLENTDRMGWETWLTHHQDR